MREFKSKIHNKLMEKSLPYHINWIFRSCADEQFSSKLIHSRGLIACSNCCRIFVHMRCIARCIKVYTDLEHLVGERFHCREHGKRATTIKWKEKHTQAYIEFNAFAYVRFNSQGNMNWTQKLFNWMLLHSQHLNWLYSMQNELTGKWGSNSWNCIFDFIFVTPLRKFF